MNFKIRDSAINILVISIIFLLVFNIKISFILFKNRLSEKNIQISHLSINQNQIHNHPNQQRIVEQQSQDTFKKPIFVVKSDGLV